jgi:Raf kinase inhibitor-like YbhB/YbcL family protein
MLAVAPDGTVYVTRRDEADVMMIKVDSNGAASGPPRRVASRPGVHGIAISKGKVYLATVHEIFKADIQPDGSFGPLEMIIHDLPDAGQHNTRTVAIGPDNHIYISVGSTCNECEEPNQENAAMLRATLDGKSRSIFASGLRDTIGWGWHPVTGEMWGMDHGIDWLGDNAQPEELNKIEKGKRYGWPYLFAGGQKSQHRDPPGGIPFSEWIKSSTPMHMGYTAHAAPMQLSFYTGAQFPAEYQGDAFISMRGSWNRRPPSGYEVLRIRFKNGVANSFEPFVTGFVSSAGESGRLCGNAVAKDGSLLFTDDRNGVIYRVSYSGRGGRTAITSAPPAEPMNRQNLSGVKNPLAIATPETKTTARLTVTSPALRNDGPIPAIYSSWDQNVSLPLSWTPGPPSTKSYAVLMEDPDAKVTPLPVVHWLAWQIPSTLTSLHEGLATLERLADPNGVRQGMNSMGKAGYTGPKPPAGDGPHHYHVQVFALDLLPDIKPGATRADLLAALKGHVVASGELVGQFARPDRPAKP